jgi:hypothetical protein
MSVATNEEQQQPKKKFPSVQEFCVALPLYAEHSVEMSETQSLYMFITTQANIDCFCVDCEQPSVFIGIDQTLEVSDYQFKLSDRVFTRKFFCSRIHSHSAFFHFRLKRGVLAKIGQSPSMADISESGLRTYRNVLNNEEYRELARAVGLASHGVGIGSFVYLRRIFERLIDEARVEASKRAGWDDAAFQRSRMDEKIALLTAHLPAFLVEQRKLYSILSTGIHSLTENECLDAFPIVRVGIELILDQKVAAKQQQDKMAEAKKRIQSLQKKLKSV